MDGKACEIIVLVIISFVLGKFEEIWLILYLSLNYFHSYLTTVFRIKLIATSKFNYCSITILKIDKQLGLPRLCISMKIPDTYNIDISCTVYQLDSQQIQTLIDIQTFARASTNHIGLRGRYGCCILVCHS